MPDAASADEAATTLAQLLETGAAAGDLERHLDGLAPEVRLAQVLRITGGGVKRLYEAVADGPLLALEELVPANATEPVIYEGRNSLALFTRFQKRFRRVAGGVVVGYNHQTWKWLTGPGFFVVKPATGEGPFGKELLFDYTAVPSEVPEGWPEYSPNERGLASTVYGNMHDWVRRVARGVVVGKAYRIGAEPGAYIDWDAYFSLTLP